MTQVSYEVAVESKRADEIRPEIESRYQEFHEEQRRENALPLTPRQGFIAERFEHSAIFFYAIPYNEGEIFRMIELICEISGDKYFLMMHGDATYSVPDGEHREEFSYRLADEPEKMKVEAGERVKRKLEWAEKIKDHGGLDGFFLGNDYCLNAGPFLSPRQFSQFVAPYLAELVAGYRSQGFYTIKHSDGNIMLILDQIAQANPHAIHSIDPQAGVDIAVVKRLYGNQLCLIGNVECGLLDTGTDDQVIESALYALRHGMPGGGYIFSTSNTIDTGMRLSRYELMLDVWRREGNYTA